MSTWMCEKRWCSTGMGCGLPGHLGVGALLAVCNPGGDVKVHAGPNDPLLHEPPGRLGARVGLPMEGVENLLVVAQRDDCAGVSAGDVVEDVVRAEWNKL